MLTPEENTLLTHVTPGTPMGALMRQHWTPVCLLEELAERATLIRDLVATGRTSHGDVTAMVREWGSRS